MVICLAVIIGFPIFFGIGLPPPGLGTCLCIVTGVAPVAALATILAMLLLGVFRGFHGKDMDDGPGPLATRELVKGAGGDVQ